MKTLNRYLMILGLGLLVVHVFGQERPPTPTGKGTIISTNDFVLNQVYTNGSALAYVTVSLAGTSSGGGNVGGAALVEVNVAGKTSVSTIATSAAWDLSVSGMIQANNLFYFTNLSGGSGSIFVATGTSKWIALSGGSSSGGASYTLPAATTTSLGGVIPDGTTLNVSGSGNLSVNIGATGAATITNYTQQTPVYNTTNYFIVGSSFAGQYGFSNRLVAGASGVLVWTNPAAPANSLVYSNLSANRGFTLFSSGFSQQWFLSSVISAANLGLFTAYNGSNNCVPMIQGTNFTAVLGTGTVPTIFASTNQFFGTNYIFSAVNTNDPSIVYCHTNGSFTFQGLTTFTTNSISTGIVEAQTLGHPIVLDDGTFPTYGLITINVPMSGQGFTRSGLVYFGTNDSYAANINTACFTLTGHDYHQMYFMANTNAPITVAYWQSAIRTGSIKDCWFSWWFWATNGTFTPDKPGNNEQQNLEGLTVNSSSSDDLSIEHDHFSDVIGASLTGDHGNFSYNTMDFCQPTGTNTWPVTTPYAVAARVSILSGGNGNCAWNIHDNYLLGSGFDYFLDMTGASSPSKDFISENDNGEGNPDTFVLIATNAGYAGINLSWTVLNPNSAVYGSSMHGYYCNLNTPTVSTIIPDAGIATGSTLTTFKIAQLRGGAPYSNSSISSVNFIGSGKLYTNTAPTLTLTNFVVGTVYTNLNQRSFISGDFILTASGITGGSINLNYTNSGVGNVTGTQDTSATGTVRYPFARYLDPLATFQFTVVTPSGGAAYSTNTTLQGL